MKTWLFAMLGTGVLCLTASAQAGQSLVDILVKHFETSKEFTIAVADKMPAEQYSFKATDAEMGFGEMVNHIANANNNYCSSAFGGTAPPKGEDHSKDAATKRLAASFDLCIDGLKKMSDADLMKIVGKAPRQSTAFERFWGGFTHTAHHRAQLEVYLRLKGIQPPDYKF
jgi:uncharacterized damage-inducible protein DinB